MYWKEFSHNSFILYPAGRNSSAVYSTPKRTRTRNFALNVRGKKKRFFNFFLTIYRRWLYSSHEKCIWFIGFKGLKFINKCSLYSNCIIKKKTWNVHSRVLFFFFVVVVVDKTSSQLNRNDFCKRWHILRRSK